MEKAVKQAISLLLAAAMMISVLPVGAFASEVDTGTVVLEGSADVQEDTGSENGSDTGTENGGDAGTENGGDAGSENGGDAGSENGGDTGTENGGDTVTENGSNTGTDTGSDTGSVDVSESVPEESKAESEEVKLPEDD